jgi:hypothetical protein
MVQQAAVRYYCTKGGTPEEVGGGIVPCFTEIKVIDNRWAVRNLGRLNCINFRHVTVKRHKFTAHENEGRKLMPSSEQKHN